MEVSKSGIPGVVLAGFSEAGAAVSAGFPNEKVGAGTTDAVAAFSAGAPNENAAGATDFSADGALTAGMLGCPKEKVGVASVSSLGDFSTTLTSLISGAVLDREGD